MADVKLQAILTLKDKMTKGLKTSQVSIKSLTKIAKIAGIAILALGAAFIGASLKAAGKFDKSIRNIGTLLGDTAANEMPKFKKGIIEIMKTLPVDPDDLGASAYNIVSAGISDTAEAMEVLKSSAELGIAGLSTTEEAVNILTSAMNVYGDETHDSTRLADILFKTVKNGKTTIAGLAQGFGKVAGIAKETGISIEDLSAATAALTTTGITASEAQTSLKAVISNLLKPTSDAEAAASRLGIEFNLAALQADGLSGLLANVTDAAGDDKQALADLFGSVEAANAIFSLTSEGGGEQFRKILADIEDQTNAMGEAVDIQTSGVEAKMQLLKGNFEAIKIELGDKLIPVIVDATSFLIENSDKIKAVIDDVLKFSGVIVDAIAFVFNAVKEPLEAVLTFILIAKDKIETGFGSITDFVGGVVEDVGSFIEDVGEAVVKGITTDEEAIVDMTEKMVEDTKAGFVEYEQNAFNTFDAFIGKLGDMYDWMVGQGKIAFETLGEFLANTIDNAGRIIGLFLGSLLVVVLNTARLIGEGIMLIAEGVAKGFEVMVDTVSSSLRTALVFAGTQMELFSRGIAKGFEIMVLEISDAFGELPALWDELIAGVLVAGDNIIDWWKRTMQSMKDIFLGFINTIPDAIEGAFKGIGNFLSGIKGGIVEAFNVGNIPGFASGGSVTGGQPVIVGEKGAELFVPNTSGNVIPNDKLGGSTINVDLRGSVVRQESDLEDIIMAVKQSLNRDLSIERLGI